MLVVAHGDSLRALVKHLDGTPGSGACGGRLRVACRFQHRSSLAAARFGEHCGRHRHMVLEPTPGQASDVLDEVLAS